MSDDKRPKKSLKASSKSMETKSIVITVDDEYLPRIDHVAGELRSLGMHVDEVLKATGLICGTADCQLAALKKVPGVMSVEAQTSFDVPPTDSPIH
ncbi:hypothetical protein GC170_18195 [bacterium]|nr:hypothetical protein [bacterium]